MTVESKNVVGTPLEPCCFDPMTGFYRDGFCNTGAADRGRHLVCALISDEFLQFSRSRGNDLITPHPEWGFPGLKEGDLWCLCVDRWLEAHDNNCAPRLKLRACHENALRVVPLEILQNYAVTDG